MLGFLVRLAWFSSRRRPIRNRSTQPNPHYARLNCEELEPRCTPSTLSVVNTNITVDENIGTAYVEVQRQQSTGVASVGVQVNAGTASASDYFVDPSQLPLQFADGQWIAVLAIAINNDMLTNGNVRVMVFRQNGIDLDII